MKYLLGLILLVSVSASAQYSPTAAKTRFVNGIGLGTKDTLTMNAADTVAMIVGRDSLVYFRYKGYWKPLAYNSSLTGYVPYTGATGAIDLNSKTVVNISHLGINTTSVPTILLRAIGDNNSTSRISLRGYSSDANSSSIRVTKFRGTTSAPQAPQSGDNLGKFELAGYGTTSSEGYPQATFEALATENWGATARGAKIQFKVTPNTTTTQAIALTINQDKSAVFQSSITASSTIRTDMGTGNSTSLILTGGSSNFQVQHKTSDINTYLYNSSAGGYIFTNLSGNVLTLDGTGIAVLSSRLNVNNATDTSLYQLNTNGNGKFTGSVTANSFAKIGGTSAQFLKADGSVDANTYLTTTTAASTYVPYTGATGAVNLGAHDLTVNTLTIGLGNNNIATNTALGYLSLFANTTGVGNTANAYFSLKNNTTGSNNTASGLYSLFTNTTGSYNVAIGVYSLQSNTTASANTSIGFNSMFSNSTGANNTSIGFYGLYSLTTGSDNVAIGYQSIVAANTASGNVGIGKYSLFSLTNGTNNISIGINSSFQLTTGSNNIFIGVGGNSITTGNSNTIIGSVAGLSSSLSNNIILADGDNNIRLQFANTGAASFSSRVNVNGATDDGSTALNVTGAGKFSSSVTSNPTAGNAFVGLAATGTNDIRYKLQNNTGSSYFGIDNSTGSVFGNGAYTTNIYTDNIASSLAFSTGANLRLKIDGSTGAATLSSLAGTGSRIVVADASGTLSATTAAPTSGTYTPTITLVTNAASSTARVCQYMRVGSVVTVSGYVTVTATTPAASSRIYMSLPISSSFTSTAQAGGAGGVPGGANIGTVIFANSTATTVSMDFLPVSGATDYWFTYTYQIL